MEKTFDRFTEAQTKEYAERMLKVIKEYAPCADCDSGICRQMWAIIRDIESAGMVQ